jgi:hypothetical protein
MPRTRANIIKEMQRINELYQLIRTTNARNQQLETQLKQPDISAQQKADINSQIERGKSSVAAYRAELAIIDKASRNREAATAVNAASAKASGSNTRRTCIGSMCKIVGNCVGRLCGRTTRNTTVNVSRTASRAAASGVNKNRGFGSKAVGNQLMKPLGSVVSEEELQQIMGSTYRPPETESTEEALNRMMGPNTSAIESTEEALNRMMGLRQRPGKGEGGRRKKSSNTKKLKKAKKSRRHRY